MPRILHLGLGNFHRAHQAVYTANAGGGWNITGVAMRNRRLRDQMQATDGHYGLGIRSVDGLNVQDISVHDRVLLASEDPQLVIDGFADLDLHIVTMTVTEKGYFLNAAGTGLNLSAPEIAADLEGRPAKTAVCMLAKGLAKRAQAGAQPLTIISCDNLSGNGTKLHRAVVDFGTAAGLFDAPDIAPWTSFPNTMVDRITPATTPDVVAEIEGHTGTPAPHAVLTEEFSEWIIEDDFACPHPDWQTAGAEFVKNVEPYELRKLRFLNAAHSYLAYAGSIKGHTYVHEAIADPELRQGVERLWDDAAATVPVEIEATLTDYRAALINRFSVPEMRHELAQIAMDGSLKLTERIVPIILANCQAGLPSPGAEAAFDAWVRYVKDASTKGDAIADAQADRLQYLLEESDDSTANEALADLVGLSDGDRA